MADKDVEVDAIQRALREITKIQDGTVTRVVKAMLERQGRFVLRLLKLEERVGRLDRD